MALQFLATSDFPPRLGPVWATAVTRPQHVQPHLPSLRLFFFAMFVFLQSSANFHGYPLLEGRGGSAVGSLGARPFGNFCVHRRSAGVPRPPPLQHTRMPRQSRGWGLTPPRHCRNICVSCGNTGRLPRYCRGQGVHPFPRHYRNMCTLRYHRGAGGFPS
jgi:hypothetical protein